MHWLRCEAASFSWYIKPGLEKSNCSTRNAYYRLKKKGSIIKSHSAGNVTGDNVAPSDLPCAILFPYFEPTSTLCQTFASFETQRASPVLSTLEGNLALVAMASVMHDTSASPRIVGSACLVSALSQQHKALRGLLPLCRCSPNSSFWIFQGHQLKSAGKVHNKPLL